MPGGQVSRIRTIKPEFFTDADLGELTPVHRLLFVGLWTQADRDGILEDKPKHLKVRLLPFDDYDVDKLLGDLAEHRFIDRYEADNTKCIVIRSFRKHQRTHPKETPSGLPSPASREISRQEIKQVESSAGKGRERKGKEGDLEEPRKERAPRKKSEQELFYSWALNRRSEIVNMPDNNWSSARINKQLQWIGEWEEPVLTLAYDLFLADERKKTLSPPCPMWAFANDYATYLDRARKELYVEQTA